MDVFTTSIEVADMMPQVLLKNASSIHLACYLPLKKLLGHHCWYHLSTLEQTPVEQLGPSFPNMSQ